MSKIKDLDIIKLIYLLNRHFCNCAINETTKPQMRQTQLGYYEALKNITEDPKYLYGREDFAVVLQPHMRDMEPPKDVYTCS